jgi:hypothetical protein
MTESAIQRAIVQGLRLLLPHGWQVVAVPNKPRSRISGAQEKAMGARAGFPDLMVLGQLYSVQRPAAWFLEVKKDGGRLSTAQREFHDRLKDLGFGVAVVRSLDDAIEAGHSWSWPLRLAPDKGRLGE